MYLHTDVTKYQDLIALFALADRSCGGVDVTIQKKKDRNKICQTYDLVKKALTDDNLMIDCYIKCWYCRKWSVWNIHTA